MKHEVENLNGHFKKLSVEIPAESVKQEYERTYKEIQKQVEIKGFRKGKVPLNMIQQNYADTATNEVSKALVQRFLSLALKEAALKPVAMPKIDFNPPKVDGTFAFTASFENMPPVELKDYSSFKAQKEDVVVTEEEVTKALDHIRDRMASFSECDEGATVSDGSVARVTHSASEAGKELKEASGKESIFEIGRALLGKEFDEALKGLKKNEKKSITIKYPEDSSVFKGKTIDYEMTVTSIMEKKLPELNEELAKKVGPFETLEALKNRIKIDLDSEKKSQQVNKVKEDFVEFLIKENPVEISETLLNNQIQYLASEAAENLSGMGMKQEQIEEKLKEWQEDMHKRSERQVKASMLLGAIAEKENIQASEDEVRNEIVRVAQQTGRQPQEVFDEIADRGVLPSLVKQLTELKTLETLARKAVE
ncbi:trigger factor [bacterium]|nr:trigger factor [bacterium]